MGKGAVVLLSGGLDSAVAGAWARAEGYDLWALTLDYGQRHRVELDAAAAVALHLQVREHLVQHVDLRAFGGSALTADIPVPKAHSPGAGPIPPTYVPARNTIFLALALGLAEARGAGALVIGANAIDYSGYPDCRPAFLKAFERLAEAGTRAGVEGNPPRILAPLIDLSKAEIVTLGHEFGVPFERTHSCYDPDDSGRHCGSCDACQLRCKGFADAGIRDPTPYAQSQKTA